MEKTFKPPGLAHHKAKEKAEQKAKELEREGNRYVRAARVLAQDDTIDVKALADHARMSETTAGRCKEAGDAVIAALVEVGRLPDPTAPKKALPKTKPVTVPESAATETMPLAPAVEPAPTEPATI